MAETKRPEPVTNAVHLCIDMQNIFARGGVWETPWMERVLPTIVDYGTNDIHALYHAAPGGGPAGQMAPLFHQMEKPGYSAFTRSALPSFLQEKNVSTVIVSGAETDVCVLSTVLDAVDLGLTPCAVRSMRAMTR
jgi:nicotinamidase-related amidase